MFGTRRPERLLNTTRTLYNLKFRTIILSYNLFHIYIYMQGVTHISTRSRCWGFVKCSMSARIPSPYNGSNHGPLARYVKLQVGHAPGIPGTFSLPPLIFAPDMHHGTCVTHVSWCMPGSLTSSFLWSQWPGKNVPSIPGACAIHYFTYMVRGPLWLHSSTPWHNETFIVTA